MRKRPVRHAVHSHKRDGRLVRAYVRGSGISPYKQEKVPNYLKMSERKYDINFISKYKFPHSERSLEEHDYHCPTCVCNLIDSEFNPGIKLVKNTEGIYGFYRGDPEDLDIHCPTCTCDNPELYAEVSKKISIMKEKARRSKR